jgi:hypothetical protein
VYGHTHTPECVPLDASYADGFVLNQLYFNTGTWRRVHRATMFAPQEQEFIPSESLSIVALFQGDERAGRPFETWNGMLGIGAADAPLYRIDAGRAEVPAPTAVSAAPAAAAPASPRAPHFAPAATTTRPAARRA